MSRALRVLLVSVLVLVAAPLRAQVVATLSWQTQPYCNVMTLTFVQQGGMYQVTGTDNGCGGAVATVTGTAVPAGSNVAAGLTVNLPSGAAAHLTASIRLSDASGTWTDADGRSGTFAFNAATGGSPRPAPAGSTAITVNQFSPTVYSGTGAAATVARSDHDHDARYYPRATADATFTTRSRLLSAVVTSAGALTSGVQAISANRVSLGGYQVNFARPVDSCSYVVSPSGNPGIINAGRGATAVLGTNTSQLFVGLYTGTTFVDAAFNVVVLCP